MKVFFFTEGTLTAAASRIRVYEYLDRLQAAGALESRTASFTSEGYCRRIVSGCHTSAGRRILEKIYQLCSVLRLIFGCLSCEAVFIQRVLLPVWVQRLIARLNRNLIYDFDDAVYLGGKKKGNRFASQVGLASRVLAVSSAAAGQATARGADPNKVIVLPSSLDCAVYRKRTGSRPDKFTVGWIGSPLTTSYLEGIWDKLASFANAHPEVHFLFIGAEQFDTGRLRKRTRFEPWTPETEKSLLFQMDVGLMPLDDDDWCRGKGGYKLIQYMAAAVATLASAVGANLEIVLEGRTGMFVRELEDWARCLEIFFSDPELCTSMGRAGRQRTQEFYDYAKTTPVFYNVLKEVIKK